MLTFCFKTYALSAQERDNEWSDWIESSALGVWGSSDGATWRCLWMNGGG